MLQSTYCTSIQFKFKNYLLLFHIPFQHIKYIVISNHITLFRVLRPLTIFLKFPSSQFLRGSDLFFDLNSKVTSRKFQISVTLLCLLSFGSRDHKVQRGMAHQRKSFSWVFKRGLILFYNLYFSSFNNN